MPKSKLQYRKHNGHISILLVDESQIARSAWRKILQRSGLAHIAGEVAPNEVLREMKKLPPSEVIIAGYSFVEKKLLRNKKFVTAWGYFPKTIIVCDDKVQVAAAYRSQANWAVAKPFNDHELVTWTRAISDEAKRLCEEYYVKLSPPDAKYSTEFDLTLVRSILQLLFHPDLVNPEKAEAHDGIPGRLVFRNQAKKGRVLDNGLIRFDDFWEDVRQDFQGKYIPVDFIGSEITPSAVQGLRMYMQNFLGMFGMIIGRGEVSHKIKSVATAIYKNEGRVILPLGDSDLQEMLEYKAGGINPACLLRNNFQDLIAIGK